MANGKDECNAYIKLLKHTEELSSEQLALARESFNEGWLQCQLRMNKYEEYYVNHTQPDDDR